MKKIFRKSVSVLSLSLISIIFSPMFAGAAAWGIGLNSDGTVSAGVASSNSALNSTLGGGFGGGWSLSNPYGLPSGSLMGIASNMLFWLLSLFAIFGVIGFVLSGIWYLLSAGEESMAEKGKEGMKMSVIGIVVGLSGFIIMQAVSALLGGASKTF